MKLSKWIQTSKAKGLHVFSIKSFCCFLGHHVNYHFSPYLMQTINIIYYNGQCFCIKRHWELLSKYYEIPKMQNLFKWNNNIPIPTKNLQNLFLLTLWLPIQIIIFSLISSINDFINVFFPLPYIVAVEKPRNLTLPKATYNRAAEMLRRSVEFTISAKLRQDSDNSVGTIVAFYHDEYR